MEYRYTWKSNKVGNTYSEKKTLIEGMKVLSNQIEKEKFIASNTYKNIANESDMDLSEYKNYHKMFGLVRAVVLANYETGVPCPKLKLYDMIVKENMSYGFLMAYSIYRSDLLDALKHDYKALKQAGF